MRRRNGRRVADQLRDKFLQLPALQLLRAGQWQRVDKGTQTLLGKKGLVEQA